MKKILIIGAGVGGLVTAYDLGKAGYDVAIYEKNKETEMSYEWFDDATLEILHKNGIEFPTKDDKCFQKNPWSFVPPFSSKPVVIKASEENGDYSLYRRDFSNFLIKRAKEFAKIKFETPVDSLLIKDEKVVGIVIDGVDIEADLVIDSSGVESKFRKSLPESFGIDKEAGPGGMIHTYRAFYNRENEFTPDLTHKIFLKHLGMIGISWFRCDFDNEVDVFVGTVSELKDSDIEKSLTQMRKDNPTLGKEFLHGGDRNVIPIRYPLTKMVGDGYVAIGDSAFMTIPLIGSGIANSVTAGKILAKTIQKGLNKENLWNYQVEYFKTVGAENMGIDAIKRWLLRTDSQDLKFLFESGIIGEKELSVAGEGGELKLAFKDVLQKVKVGYKKMGLLLNLVKAVKGIDKATALGNEIPTKYDETAINNWQNKVKKFYSKI